MGYYASEMVKLAKSWVGKNEADGTHKEIIDIYNSYTPRARGYKVQYTDAWCATTISALGIKLGYTSIIPIECGCGEMISLAQAKGIWVEKENRTPKAGELILYDWDDTASYKTTDDKGWPEHVGIVEKVSGNTITVIEGNYKNAVTRRTIEVNGRYIRGFITPKYDAEPVVEKPVATTQPTKPATSTPTGTQTTVKKVTTTAYAKSKDANLAGTYKATTDVYMRNDAGPSNKALVVVPKGHEVKNYGYYTTYAGVKWLCIQTTIKGVVYTGFSSSKYYTKQ